MKKKIAFLYPLSFHLSELKLSFHSPPLSEEYEVLELDDYKELGQLLGLDEQIIILGGDPKKLAKLLIPNSNFVKSKMHHAILVSDSEYPDEIMSKLTPHGLFGHLSSKDKLKTLTHKIEQCFKLNAQKIHLKQQEENESPLINITEKSISQNIKDEALKFIQNPRTQEMTVVEDTLAPQDRLNEELKIERTTVTPVHEAQDLKLERMTVSRLSPEKTIHDKLETGDQLQTCFEDSKLKVLNEIALEIPPEEAAPSKHFYSNKPYYYFKEYNLDHNILAKSLIFISQEGSLKEKWQFLIKLTKAQSSLFQVTPIKLIFSSASVSLVEHESIARKFSTKLFLPQLIDSLEKKIFVYPYSLYNQLQAIALIEMDANMATYPHEEEVLLSLLRGEVLAFTYSSQLVSEHSDIISPENINLESSISSRFWQRLRSFFDRALSFRDSK